ncbi:alkaline-phosphatase-like protein [Xylariaceae sp. FL0255]|nr:alkaline-phosphatase-like protein [Xylariaceae sp. FL0255]
MGRNYMPSVSTILLVVANLLIPISILIFANGFFPYKPFLSGLAQYDDDLGLGSPPPAPFDKLIFMVVDALRSDFVFLKGSGFNFTQSLIEDGVTIPFTAHATSPTITMPRIKAMTTGSTPSFLDAILSFDEADTSSTLATQDTWLAQMKAKDTGKLVMYGDDTWLKLFPGVFDRADGTTSFFVSDFTEVDNNVTRHVPDELRNDDWNTMVLHYLGLDHIGHKTGPRGPNMIPKQREMDGIARDIYEAMEKEEHLKSTLLVLCGDHGMNDAGNHGASSAGETSAAMVFISPKLRSLSAKYETPSKAVEDFRYHRLIQQSDLAPTLAGLLGFPVPKNSLGLFIADFLPLWPEPHDQLKILMGNAKQMLSVLHATLGASTIEEAVCRHSTSLAVKLVCEWQAKISHVPEKAMRDDANPTEWMVDIMTWLYEAQDLMSGMASNYDVALLVMGWSVAAVAVSTAIAAMLASTNTNFAGSGALAMITILYGVMMFASSYVEEEQHFWYWSTTAWLFYLVFKRAQRPVRSLLLVGGGLGMMRLLRSWNQTGQKFAGEADIVTTYMIPNPILLWILVFVAYTFVGIKLLQGLKGTPMLLSGPIVAGVATSALSFKLQFAKHDAPELIGMVQVFADMFDGPPLVNQARTVFMGIGLISLYPIYLLILKPSKSVKEQSLYLLHYLFSLVALTQSRVTNIPLFLPFNCIYLYLRLLDLMPVEITISSLLLQYTSFFAMGGSNTFTGIDLSSAYNGVNDFNVVLVGLLTYVSNWAGPMWWVSASNLLLLRRRKTSLQGKKPNTDDETTEVSFTPHACLLTGFVAASLCFVMAACTALKTHLFIWSVFSPKYLYSIAWSLGQHLAVNMILGGILFRLGSS